MLCCCLLGLELPGANCFLFATHSRSIKPQPQPASSTYRFHWQHLRWLYCESKIFMAILDRFFRWWPPHHTQTPDQQVFPAYPGSPYCHRFLGTKQFLIQSDLRCRWIPESSACCSSLHHHTSRHTPAAGIAALRRPCQFFARTVSARTAWLKFPLTWPATTATRTHQHATKLPPQECPRCCICCWARCSSSYRVGT